MQSQFDTLAAVRWLGVALVSTGLVVLTACGSPTASAPTSAAASPAPAPSATTARAAASPAASPSPSPAVSPTATSVAARKPETVWVGNTDGIGVYMRKTPAMADRLQAYPDKTALTVIGDDVESEGQRWKRVRTPDGLEGYVPAIYTVETPP